jgi:hypothetical protein
MDKGRLSAGRLTEYVIKLLRQSKKEIGEVAKKRFNKNPSVCHINCVDKTEQLI